MVEDSLSAAAIGEGLTTAYLGRNGVNMVEDSLSAAAIGEGLTTAYLGRNLHYEPHMASTNDEARRLADEGAPEGTLVITDYQSAGRGRFERRWYAPRGSSLLLTPTWAAGWGSSGPTTLSARAASWVAF